MDLGTQIPDSSGTVRFTFSTAALEPGVHTVVLTSGETSVRATFTVVSAAATLPATGSDIPPAALAAAVLALLVGIGLVVRGRFVR
jgi:LPXTG-motif cell wall-anchored protein